MRCASLRVRSAICRSNLSTCWGFVPFTAETRQIWVCAWGVPPDNLRGIIGRKRLHGQVSHENGNGLDNSEKRLVSFHSVPEPICPIRAALPKRLAFYRLNVGRCTRSVGGTRSTGLPALRQAARPPTITNVLNPCCRSRCATRALVASRGQVQYR
jgi:hypothetical protein